MLCPTPKRFGRPRLLHVPRKDKRCDRVKVSTPAVVRGSRAYLLLKRVFDVIAALAGLALCAIPMGLIALLIRLETKGPVIYRQERLGKDGIPFVMYKFHSMRLDAEKNGAQWAEVNDSRCTRIGRLLRRFHADELPQLWNILRGEMSLVGPRPEREHFYREFDAYIPHFRERLRVMPGLTGLSQVNGGYDLLPEERLEYDLKYMAERSLALDLMCVLKTVVVVLNGKGAR